MGIIVNQQMCKENSFQWVDLMRWASDNIFLEFFKQTIVQNRGKVFWTEKWIKSEQSDSAADQ